MITYCQKLVSWDDIRLNKLLLGKMSVQPCFECIMDNHDEWYCRDKELMRARYREDDNDKTESA